jgi:RimJ/RimL family protein N-acetyltransferase
MERIIFSLGKKYSLGVLDPADAPILANWLNQEELRQYLSRYEPLYLSAEEEYIRQLPERQPGNYVFGIVKNENKQLIGTIGLHNINHKDRRAVAGIFIGDQNKRQNGAGTEAGRLLLEYAFHTLNLRKVTHEAFATNDGSVALAKKNGGQLEGRLKEQMFIQGRYVDLLIFAYYRPGEEPAGE